MCTLSWRQEADTLDVWFNRDEQRTRPAALPPEHVNPGHPFLAPRDPQGGGTWIFVNHAGQVGAVLNHYAAMRTAPPAPNVRSRGLLVMDLAEFQEPTALSEALTRQVVDHSYSPFLFCSLSLDHPVRLWRWDGKSLAETPQPDIPMITTSSYKSEEVIEHRRSLFLEQVRDSTHPDSAELERFHALGQTQPSAWTPHMSREDARTVSTSHIRIENDRADFFYCTPEKDAPVQTSLDLLTRR